MMREGPWRKEIWSDIFKTLTIYICKSAPWNKGPVLNWVENLAKPAEEQQIKNRHERNYREIVNIYS